MNTAGKSPKLTIFVLYFLRTSLLVLHFAIKFLKNLYNQNANLEKLILLNSIIKIFICTILWIFNIKSSSFYYLEKMKRADFIFFVYKLASRIE